MAIDKESDSATWVLAFPVATAIRFESSHGGVLQRQFYRATIAYPRMLPPQMSDFAKLVLTAILSAIGGLTVGVLLEPAKAYFKRRRLEDVVYDELASISSILRACQIDGSMSLEVELESLAGQSRENFLMRIDRLRPKRIRHFLDSEKDSFYGMRGANEIEHFYTKVEAFVFELPAMEYAGQVRNVCDLVELFKYYEDLGLIERKRLGRHCKRQWNEGFRAVDNLARSFAGREKGSPKYRRFMKKYGHLLRKDEETTQK